MSGDYAQGGGYQFISGPGAGPVDGISAVTTRNATARLDYAPSANLSAFVSGHLFGDNRNLGTALSTENRADGALNFGVNYGDSFGGTFTGRAWVRDMRENQFQTTIAHGADWRGGQSLLTAPSRPLQLPADDGQRANARARRGEDGVADRRRGGGQTRLAQSRRRRTRPDERDVDEPR